MSFFSLLNVAAFREAETNATTHKAVTSVTAKPFIYLTQTEQCLPQHLASSTRIGDSKTCNCDVIVLSYKEECRDKKPSHISYVFAKESTWTTGRNLLYFVAIERIRHYHYYIFLDDDVDLGFNSFSSQEMKRLTPFRAFEEWLLDDEPAVGVTNYKDNTLLQRRRLMCGTNESSVVVPVMWFDALFNAFNHEAIRHILPYPTQYDKQSWWISQLHVICSVELTFRGQALENAAICAYNKQHRAYPRGDKLFSARIPVDIIENIQNKAPAAYQNRTLFKTLKTGQLERHCVNTTTYCMNTTHRHPIVPYSHFEGQS